MSVSRTRSKSSKGKAAKKNYEEQEMVEGQTSNAIVRDEDKTKKKGHQIKEDIWDVGNVYNQDNVKPKKPIVTYSKRKYKPRPEIGSRLTNIYSKGQHQKQHLSKTHDEVDSTSSQKSTADLQSKINPHPEQHNDSSLIDTNHSRAIDRPDEANEPQDEIDGYIAKGNLADKDPTPLDGTPVIKSRSETGKRKEVNGAKSKPVKKSLSISRTRKQKQEQMKQDKAATTSTPPVLPPLSTETIQGESLAPKIGMEDIAVEEAKQSELKPSQTDYNTTQYDQNSNFDNLDIGLDQLKLSPIGSVSTEARRHKRVVSSTPMGTRILQHMHASKPAMTFAESLEKADMAMRDNGEAVAENPSPKGTMEVETHNVAPSLPQHGPEVTESLEEEAISGDNQRLAPASISDTDFPSIPINAVTNIQEHRKAIEASIVEPTIYHLGNAQIWSPPRSPSIEVARRESQRSESQHNIPEGIFEWFGSNMGPQDNATSEQQPVLDEDLEQFLTPDQLNMTVEQFMRSIYEEKIEQVRNDGQQRIDRLDGEIARVRAKLLAELVECDS